MTKPFDNEKYLNAQKKAILERIEKLKSDKLYVEIGGKFIDDMNASRVLPGFDPGAKARLASIFNGDAELILCVSSDHIEQNKIRADNSLTYDREVLRLIDEIKELGISICAVVITLFKGQAAAEKFGKKLIKLKQKVYFHTPTKGYPNNIDVIVSSEGYGANPHIKTSKKIVFVVAPGPCSGKLGTCLSQLYHDYKNGINAGYCKYETFPVWNIPLQHPVNVSYEAATAELGDVNVIDPFQLQATGEVAVNYNRDVECFPVLERILKRIMGVSPYKSPTQMGVNCIKEGIINDEGVQLSAQIEIYRRLLRAEVDAFIGNVKSDVVLKIKMLASDVGADDSLYKVKPACEIASAASKTETFAIELKNGKIVLGKAKKYLSACSACVLNAIKELAGLDDELYLISEDVLKPILSLKTILGKNQARLHLEDTLIALAVSSIASRDAKKAIEKLPELAQLVAHSSVILSAGEQKTLRNLKIEFTSTPTYSDDKVFRN